MRGSDKVFSRGKRAPLADRFWEKVDKNGPDGCWNWLGSLTHGHGILWVAPNHQMAHRVSLELHGIALIKGLFVDHLCRNRKCVNPEHLRQVTPRQNALENNDSCFAKLAAATHCKRGHSYTPDNLRPDKRGGRGQCKTCMEMRKRGELPRRQPRAGWGTKIKGLSIGGTLIYPNGDDATYMTAAAKKMGLRVEVKRLSSTECLVTRVA